MAFLNLAKRYTSNCSAWGEGTISRYDFRPKISFSKDYNSLGFDVPENSSPALSALACYLAFHNMITGTWGVTTGDN